MRNLKKKKNCILCKRSLHQHISIIRLKVTIWTKTQDSRTCRRPALQCKIKAQTMAVRASHNFQTVSLKEKNNLKPCFPCTFRLQPINIQQFFNDSNTKYPSAISNLMYKIYFRCIWLMANRAIYSFYPSKKLIDNSAWNVLQYLIIRLD